MSSDPSPDPADQNPFTEPSPVQAEAVVGHPESKLEVVSASSGGQWLHPMSIMFDAISNGRRNLFPAIVALMSAARGGRWGIWVAIVIFGLSLFGSVLRYLTLRYQIQNGELIVREGLIFKRVRTVPLVRIQNIDSTQTILHRIFGVAEVRVETAAGKEPEAKLRVLSLDKISQLRETVFRERANLPPASASDAGEPETSESVYSDASDSPDSAMPESELIHSVSFGDLIRAGVASNRGILVFGVLVGAFFQFDVESWFSWFDFDALFDLIPEDLGLATYILSISSGLLLFFVLTRIYGAVWYVNKFFGYQLTRVKDDFRISCGLFTKISATVPRKRIQFISVHETLFMRWLGLAAIRIETAGGSGQSQQDAASSVGKRWFVPVVQKSKVDSLVEQLRDDLDWDLSDAEWVGVSPKTGRRLCRLAVIQAVVIGLVGLAITRPWGWLAGVAVLPFFIYLAIRKSRAMRYTEMENGVVYRSGVLTKKLSVTFYDRIQTLQLNQSPFDRRWKMATLSVDTAAAGPAEHRVSVKYLDEAVARKHYDALSKKLVLEV